MGALKSALDMDDDLVLLLATIQQASYMKGFEAPHGASCYEYSDEEVYDWNFYLWNISFFLFGLQFTHLDVGPLSHYSINLKSIKNWGVAGWTFTAVIVALALSIFYFDIKGLLLSDCLWRYILWLVVLVGFFVWNTCR